MKLKRLIAGVVSAAMMLSIGSTLAFANSIEFKDDTMTFDSVMYLSNDANGAPNVVYTYTIAAGDATDSFNYNGTTSNFIAGVTEGIIGINGSTVTVDSNDLTAQVEFSTSDDPTADATADTNTVTKDVSFDFDGVTYTEPGIYVYTIEETSAPTAADTDGLINESTTTRYVYVTVKNATAAATNTTYVISNIIMTEEAIEVVSEDENDGDADVTTLVADATKSAGYIHSFGIAGDDDDTDPQTPDEPGTVGSNSQDFVITTTVKGDMANPNKDFAFATITADLGDELVGMEFTVVNGYAADGTTPITSITVGEDGTLNETFYMSSNDSDVYILGVVDGMVFTVSISDADEDGYSFYYRAYDEDYVAADVEKYANLNGWTSTTGASEDFTVDTDYTKDDGVDFATVRGADDTTTLTADDEQDPADDDLNIEYDAAFPETGVVLDLLPYVVMVALAGAFIAFRVVKSARKDEE